MSLLQKINIILPNTDIQLNKQILHFLSHFGEISDFQINFTKSQNNFFPNISLKFEDFSIPVVRFYADSHPIHVELVNKTDIEKKSTYSYSHIEMSDFIKRLEGVEITYLDHVGFDLPWFDGIHPEMLELRQTLKLKSLYHLFPTGEAWDFIIPGTEKEMAHKTTIDYSKVRKPKFEIVSLNTVSVPLIQIDFSIKAPYADLVKLFPEAIHDKELKNMWVYITNPYNIDICFVVNEHVDGDWSNFFRESRI
ncbi:MAG TPA: hypothetical protein PLS49_01585 [Candidatus Woesebacteria bacterium]|nr:hypothetical protein [Candidatus Woesebacteria bacterium]